MSAAGRFCYARATRARHAGTAARERAVLLSGARRLRRAAAISRDRFAVRHHDVGPAARRAVALGARQELGAVDDERARRRRVVTALLARACRAVRDRIARLGRALARRAGRAVILIARVTDDVGTRSGLAGDPAVAVVARQLARALGRRSTGDLAITERGPIRTTHCEDRQENPRGHRRILARRARGRQL